MTTKNTAKNSSATTTQIPSTDDIAGPSPDDLLFLLEIDLRLGRKQRFHKRLHSTIRQILETAEAAEREIKH